MVEQLLGGAAECECAGRRHSGASAPPLRRKMPSYGYPLPVRAVLLPVVTVSATRALMKPALYPRPVFAPVPTRALPTAHVEEMVGSDVAMLTNRASVSSRFTPACVCSQRKLTYPTASPKVSGAAKDSLFSLFPSKKQRKALKAQSTAKIPTYDGTKGKVFDDYLMDFKSATQSRGGVYPISPNPGCSSSWSSRTAQKTQSALRSACLAIRCTAWLCARMRLSPITSGLPPTSP